MDDLSRIEQSLTEARDELVAYWEQPDGQACVLALRIAHDALAEYRERDGPALPQRDPERWQRIRSLVDEITRLRAPLEGSM